jgi:hypothetical protein
MGNFYMELRNQDEVPLEKNPLRTRSISNVEERLLELESQVNRLLLINAALYDVIKVKLGVTDEDISNRIKELNEKSSLFEPINDQLVRKCKKCGKNLIQRRSLCVYCGTDNSD